MLECEHGVEGELRAWPCVHDSLPTQGIDLKIGILRSDEMLISRREVSWQCPELFGCIPNAVKMIQINSWIDISQFHATRISIKVLGFFVCVRKWNLYYCVNADLSRVENSWKARRGTG